MKQITTDTLIQEFGLMSTSEKLFLVNDYFLVTPNNLLNSLKSVHENLGDRTFRNSQSVNDLTKKSSMTKANSVIMAFSEFADVLIGNNIDSIKSVLSAEILARNLARQLELPSDQTIRELKKMRSIIRSRLHKQETKVNKIAQSLTGSHTDYTYEGDPLNRKREYMFYDAYIVIKGPGRIKILDFNEDITSISVSLTVDVNPGNFSATLANPMEQYVDDAGCYAFHTGDSVTIWATRRFQKPGKDRYIQIFWGILEQVSDEYSNDGSCKVTISGQDIVAWLQYTTISKDATFLELVINSLNPNLFPSGYNFKYEGQSILQIIANVIFNNMSAFNMVDGYNLVNNTSGSSSNIAEQQANAESSRKSTVEFWRELYADELKVYVFGHDEPITKDNSVRVASVNVKKAGDFTEIDRQLIPTKDSICNAQKMLEYYVPFRIFSEQAAGAFQIEDIPRLEVIRRICDGLMYEFFMDISGSLIFKPPFYNEYPCNNDTAEKRYDNLKKSGGCSGNMAQSDKAAMEGFAEAYEYTIKDMDIISSSLKEDSSCLVTRQHVTIEYPEVAPPTSVTDGGAQNNDLVKRYGMRVGSPKKIRFLSNSADAIVAAKAVMDYVNTKYYSGTIQIICRPEIHQGRTIYLEARNVIFYVTGIQHNYAPGGASTTTLTVQAGRRMLLNASGSPRENIFDGEQFTEDGEAGNKELDQAIDSAEQNITAAKEQKKRADASGNEKDKKTADYNLEMAQGSKNSAIHAKDRKAILDTVRKNGNITSSQIEKLGQPPRRISDSKGRRLYGMLSYGILATPPKLDQSEEAPNKAKEAKASAGANRSNSKTTLPTAAGKAGLSKEDPSFTELSKYSVLPNQGTKAVNDMKNSAGSTGTGKEGSIQKEVIESAKSCATTGKGKAFNASSIIRKRTVQGSSI